MLRGDTLGMTTSRKIAFTAALGAALAFGMVAAPAASAEPVVATTLSPVIGAVGGTGSAGWGGALVNESVTVRVDPERPGFSRFGSSIQCHCVVHWTNVTTGQRGAVTLPIYPTIPASPYPSFETGSGRIEAVVTTTDITFLAGRGSWTVP
ncbi:hypothetical protein B9C99_01915 [Rhodococcus sp. BUPNP1]|nr:hypothetical protein B9C99_01915 [Rhodococcus sp. BUPNP1]